VIGSAAHGRQVGNRSHDRLEAQVSRGTEVEIDVDSGHHQIGSQELRPTPGIGDQGGIIADPDLARRGRPSRGGLKSRLQGSDYLEFICTGSACTAPCTATCITADTAAETATGIATSGVSAGTAAKTVCLAWFRSNHVPCLAFKPLFTDYY
jgi:hypothetical protein